MSFDEMYDETVHAEFLSGAVDDPAHGADAAARAIFGTPRRRSIAVIASGGLAFAALGAFLGGLGSDVAVSPAAAHPLTTSHLSLPPGSALGPTNPPFRAGTLALGPADSGAVTPSTTNDGSPVGAASAPVTTVGGGSSGGAPLPSPVIDGPTIPAVPLPIAAFPARDPDREPTGALWRGRRPRSDRHRHRQFRPGAELRVGDGDHPAHRSGDQRDVEPDLEPDGNEWIRWIPWIR